MTLNQKQTHGTDKMRSVHSASYGLKTYHNRNSRSILLSVVRTSNMSRGSYIPRNILKMEKGLILVDNNKIVQTFLFELLEDLDSIFNHD